MNTSLDFPHSEQVSMVGSCFVTAQEGLVWLVGWVAVVE